MEMSGGEWGSGRWVKRMMGCRVGVQGEMWSEARGGCRAAQSRVKSGVQGGSAGWDVE